MRVLQFHTFYRGYLDYFDKKYPDARTSSSSDRLALLLSDRFMAVHILAPAYRGDPDFRFVVSNDDISQRRWAAERQFPARNLTDILLAQIEEHQAEVIYSLNPVPYTADFLRRLPGCVKHTVCWMASPINGADLSGYTLRVCNFPNFLDDWKAKGWRSAWFDPAFDPIMANYATNQDRPIDIAFVGQYSRLHQTRNVLLERLATLGDRFRVTFSLLHPRWRPLSDLRGLRRIPTFVPYLPKQIRKVAQSAEFGIGAYELLSRSKIVLNAAIDVAGCFRGNMRCFEVMGCGACMVSDQGIYPPGFTPGEHFETFANAENACQIIESLLAQSQKREGIAKSGHDFVASSFAKEEQWRRFVKLVSDL